MDPRWILRSSVLVSVLAAMTVRPAAGFGPRTGNEMDLARIRQLSMEELMSVDVTTVTGVAQEWFKTPAAMTVITAEDIRRSGLTSLPEVLRLVPGMFVGQQTSSFWRIGTRGFLGASLPAPRNLVLIDGRAVYDPLWGGVFWDAQQIPLADIRRIEVIRGPGPMLWGPNAVNGVINVVTRSSRDTQGWLLSGSAGTHQRGTATARLGFPLSRSAWMRVDGFYADYGEFESSLGEAGDRWAVARGGFRFDMDNGEGLQVVAHGGLYGSPRLGARRRLPVPDRHLVYEQRTGDDDIGGGHLLAWARRDFGALHQMRMRAYLDFTRRDRLGGLSVDRENFDAEFRHHLRWSRREVAWGLGWRNSADETEPGVDVSLRPPERHLSLLSGFVQASALTPVSDVWLMAGTKITRHSAVGWELQPGIRIWWTPDEVRMLWAAATRPVRQPSRIELDGRITLGYVDSGILQGREPSGQIVAVGVQGNPDLESERGSIYEVGGRMRLGGRLTLDAVLWHNRFNQLISIPPNQLGRFSNRGEGKSYGAELAGSWRVLPWWMLRGAYAITRVEHEGPVLRFESRNSPRHLAHLISLVDLGEHFEITAAGYHVSALELGSVPDRTRLDLSVTWLPRHFIEISLRGQNLARSRTREVDIWGVPRSVLLQGTLRT